VVPKRSFFFLFLFVLTSCDDSSNSDENYLDRLPVHVVEDGSKFQGEVSADGVISGYGRYTWEGGDYYEGDWKDHKMSGFGKLTKSNGDIYG